MRWLSRPMATGARTAVLHTPAAVAAAVVDTRSSSKPRLLHLCAENRTRGALHWTAAQALLKAMPHRGTPVTALLPPGNYHLLQMDAANVPEPELRDAMRWKLQGLIDQSPESVAVDLFPLPPRPHMSATRQLFVVAAEQWRVDEQTAMVEAASRQLDVIDIPELALRNIMSLLPGEAEGCAMLVLARGFVQILVSRGGNLYVIRKIEGTNSGDVERLSLDVQRSLQYYETHFDGAPITRLVLAPAGQQAANLAPMLADATGLECEPLQLQELLETETPQPLLEQFESLLVLGAALRTPRERERVQ